MMIRRISPFLPLPLLVALALAGCANTDSGAAAPAPASSAPAPAPASSEPAPASSAPASPAKETLTGTITAGVEPDCLLLEDHLLVIQDPKLKAAAKVGATVTVTGRAERGMMTTCQQGTPFVVTALRAN